MKKAIILGVSAHAAEIEQYIFENNSKKNEIEILGFVSDPSDTYTKYSFRYPFLGKSVDLKYLNENVEIIIGFSNIQGRENIISTLKNLGFNFLTFIHHTAIIFPSAIVEEGCMIGPYCQVGPNVKIGKFNTLNNKVSIGHDSVIGSNNIFSPSVGITGYNTIGNNNFFSINSVSIPHVSIGNSNVIAPNMVIDKNIKSDSTYFHRFKEVVLAIPKNITG